MLAGLRTVQAFAPVGVRNFHSVRSSAVPRAQRFCRQSARAMASDEAAAARAAVKAGCARASRGEGHTTQRRGTCMTHMHVQLPGWRRQVNSMQQ